MDKLKAYLVLGCNGHSGKDGFIHCTGISNIIVDFENINDNTYIQLMNFLEGPCELFENPIYNRNKISNVLNIINRDYKAIPHSMLFNIQSFMQMHKKCGHYLILIMKEDYIEYGQ